jgi:hypothetical protein
MLVLTIRLCVTVLGAEHHFEELATSRMLVSLKDKKGTNGHQLTVHAF